MSSSRRPFGCNLCSKTFTRSENLERHKRSAHEDEARRTFECPHCEARFSRRDVCKRHTNRCANTISRQQETDLTIPSVTDGDTFFSPDITAAAPDEDSPQSNLEPCLNGQQETSPFNHLTPTGIIRDANAHITAYFEYFHPVLPLVHRATFDISSTPKPLVNIIIVIGSLYSVRFFPENETSALIRGGQELWQQGSEELRRLVSNDWRELRKTWMIQTFLLHIVYGAFMHETTEHAKTRSMLRSLVDAVRDLGLLKQVVAISTPQTWLVNIIPNGTQFYSTQLHGRWQSYIDEESLKLSIYTLLLLDHHVFSPCNLHPLLSPLEFSWELPLASSLWEAEDAQLWQQKLYDEYGRATTGLLESPIRIPRHASTFSLSEASQAIMSGVPHPELVEALSASPMAVMCILTNMEVLVRDFTRCYYQLPPSPSDPSAFHILTQSQNRRVHAALKVIHGIIEERTAMAITESDQSIWQACQVLSWSVKMSLCRPDDLLVSGIAENRVFAGLLTATHLTLGSYVTFKRTTHALTQQNFGQTSGDDSIIAIMDDLTEAMSGIASLAPDLAIREVPWITTASYRILLIIWQALRQSIANTRKKLEKSLNAGPNGRTLGSSALIFNSIMEIALQYDCQPDTNAKQTRLWTVDPTTLMVTLDESEATFMNLVMRICRDRSVWAIGPSMAGVVSDIIATRANLQTQVELG
ncbi:hypothetical protein F4677DRAFT_338783 [Hypoxylon crocopeplum]|nr:hypothetical protein F4677DRAFT_338783 [Hypoxylon crocopeplum]